jgi:hypothetical protein
VGDDLEREAMVFVADGLDHAGSLYTPHSDTRVNVTTPPGVARQSLRRPHPCSCGG